MLWTIFSFTNQFYVCWYFLISSKNLQLFGFLRPGAMCVMVLVGLGTLATNIITMVITIISMVGMAIIITIIIMVAWTTDLAHFVVDLAAEGELPLHCQRGSQLSPLG